MMLLSLFASLLGVCAAQMNYGLIVDAGSSGSRLRMYQRSSSSPLSEISPSSADAPLFEVKPGLSSYADTPSQAGPSLAGPIEAAKTYIPKDAQASALLFVKATAGMRLLVKAKAKAVFDAVRAYLGSGGTSNSTFKFVSAETISGEEEGVFGYLSVNYLLGNLASNSTTVGALDLGGASTQVTFKPIQDIRDNEFDFYVEEARQTVYTKSYIRYGQDQALLRSFESLVMKFPGASTIDHPCFNLGFNQTETVLGSMKTFVGTSNATECSALAKNLLHIDYECLMPACAIAGEHMTEVTGSFQAFNSFFYTANGLGLVGWSSSVALSRKQIYDAATTICAKNITAAVADSGQAVGFAKLYCFMGFFMSHVLEAYGFAENDSTSVIYSRKIAGKSADWTAGAALFESQSLPLVFTKNLCSASTTSTTSSSGTSASTTSPMSVSMAWRANMRAMYTTILVVLGMQQA
mmetsp:Transcript_87613/g.230866  ORF Transcript_87613/g.230866 Transcript_87613/m.230866 type:complete len:465 (-) Transcript_87613:70-1464(-)